MRSKMTILAIVLGAAILSLGILAVLMVTLGPWGGLAVGVGIAAATLLLYRLAVQPWQHRWGATGEDVRRSMPGDEVIPGAHSTTRAITIQAAPEEVWPWLVQIGYGRAGWYSYDWIDNDGRPSADRIVPEFQQLRVGDQIVMVPGMGPRVRAVEANRWILSGDEETGTWCLALYPAADGITRLVSRWRQDWPITPATLFWILISDPGAFLMERKMLKGIKERAELAAAEPAPLPGVEAPMASVGAAREGSR
jgi:hypothetical protein